MQIRLKLVDCGWKGRGWLNCAELVTKESPGMSGFPDRLRGSFSRYTATQRKNLCHKIFYSRCCGAVGWLQLFAELAEFSHPDVLVGKLATGSLTVAGRHNK